MRPSYEEQNYEDYEAGYKPIPNKNQDFMQFLFDFQDKVIIPLENTWRGRSLDQKTQTWTPVKVGYQVMNDEGIAWCISFIQSYINPVFIVSNFDEQQFNFRMRAAVRIVFNKLAVHWKEWDLKKTDIPRVADEIESKICAILLGARGDGYRKLFSTGRHITEVKSHNIQEMPRQTGMFNLGSKIFKRDPEVYN